MKNKKTNPVKASIFFLIAISITLLITGCSDPDVQSLQNKEIREYEGKRLDSVTSFRENSIKGPQKIDITSYHLEITGLVDEPKNYTYEEILSRPKFSKIVKLNCVEGWSSEVLWEGILIKDMIEDSDPKKEANTVIFYAYDGYSTSFPIEYITQNKLILAYKMNNITLPEERGFPFQLVAESKWGYKWIKWITKIELSNNTDYKGYWERRGYSNKGDLNQSFFD